MPGIDRFTTSLSLPLTERLLGGRTGEQLPTSIASDPGQVDFASLISGSLSEVNSLQNQSTQSVQELLTGGDVQPAEVFASVQKADMAFRMLLQVRNKLMQAYEEVNSIRI